MSSMFRSRWAAVGAAVAVTLASGGLSLVKAAPISSGDKPVFVAIEPCRLIDTRPGYPVGPFNSPIAAGGSITVTATGTSGDCTGIPTDVTSVALNVTALFATEPTDLRIYPTGASLPDTSNLNPVPGQTVFNAVTTDVTGGQFDIRNFAGQVHVIADLTGYYIDHNHDDRYYQKTEVDANDLWAVVRSDATLARGSNVTSTGTTVGGGYEVIFNRDVSQCAYVATAGRDAGGVPLARFAGVASRDGNANGVHVRLWDANGALKQDSAFHLTVHC